MSEQINSGFPFTDASEAEGLDFDAIFGGTPSGAAPSPSKHRPFSRPRLLCLRCRILCLRPHSTSRR